MTEGTANRVGCLTLTAHVMLPLFFFKEAFQAQNRIKQPAVESCYTITMAYIQSLPQHKLLPQMAWKEGVSLVQKVGCARVGRVV